MIDEIKKMIKDEIRELKFMRDNTIVDESYMIYNGEVIVLDRVLNNIEEIEKEYVNSNNKQ